MKEKTIQKEFMERVYNGEPFYIDFKKKDIRVGNDYLVKGGVYDENRKLVDEYFLPDGYTYMDLLENLFHIYKYSYPSEAETKQKKLYFKALEADMMTDEEMIEGVDRTVARACLEVNFLVMVLTGKLKWKEEYGTWYYRGKKNPDFIVLKEWVE